MPLIASPFCSESLTQPSPAGGRSYHLSVRHAVLNWRLAPSAASSKDKPPPLGPSSSFETRPRKSAPADLHIYNCRYRVNPTSVGAPQDEDGGSRCSLNQSALMLRSRA